jgi:glycerophosphoryl diester phosphodiesterase
MPRAKTDLHTAMHRTQIIAHRGLTDEAEENTLGAFERAVGAGADGVEFDVRLTADRVPVVYHYYYLDGHTSASGPIFDLTHEQLRAVEVHSASGGQSEPGRIPALEEVLCALAGRTGLQIDMKGPEPEAPQVIGAALARHKAIWDSIEVTSYDPALLLVLQAVCPGLTTDLLLPLPPSWMGLEVFRHEAIQYGRLAHAKAVHIHPTLLSEEMVTAVRDQGLEVHSWQVNDSSALEAVFRLGIPRFDTDRVEQALKFRAHCELVGS